MTSDKFWMVWCPSKNPPAHRHESRDSAKAEAERLARKFRGHRFIVLEALSSVVVDDAQWTDLKVKEVELPF